MNRTKPYFFSFDVKNTNQMTGHYVTVESLVMPRGQFEEARFTIFPADYDKDKRLRDLVSAAHSFWEMNIRPELPKVYGTEGQAQWTKESILTALSLSIGHAHQYPELMAYIQEHGLPPLAPKEKKSDG